MARAVERILLASLALAAVAVVSGCGVEVGSASPAVDRLRRMVAAESALSFQGVQEIEFFAGPARRRWLFVTKLAGGATVMETFGEATGRQRTFTEYGGRLSWLSDLDLLLANYEVRATGRERVVDREGIVLTVSGCRPERPSVRLVVDEATDLLLSAEFRDWKGCPTFRTRFDTLLLGADVGDPGESRPVQWENWPARPLDEGEPGPEFASLSPHYLPDGFVARRTRRFHRYAESVYSDGLAWIWIMQSPAAGSGEERVVRQQGEGARLRMRVTLAGVDVRLVGRLAPRELIRILTSMGPETETRISADGSPIPAYNETVPDRARYVLDPDSEGSTPGAELPDRAGYGT